MAGLLITCFICLVGMVLGSALTQLGIMVVTAMCLTPYLYFVIERGSLKELSSIPPPLHVAVIFFLVPIWVMHYKIHLFA